MLSLRSSFLKWKFPFRLHCCTLQNTASYNPVTESIHKTLKSIVGDGNHSSSRAVREQHGRDESYHKVLPPDAVVFPTSVQQVQEIAKYALGICLC